MIKQLHLDIALRDDATFANYLGEASNIKVLNDPWLYVWGLPGTGRSHILQALCHHHEKSIYLESLCQYHPDILTGLESIDIICIDDIHEILADKEWEEALFHLMNSARDEGKQIILSGDKAAPQLGVVLPDLRSRLISATAVQTDDLSDEEKLEVMVARAQRRGYGFSLEVGRFLLARIDRDMRKLADILDKVEGETLSQGKTVTIPFIKKILNL
ncbi:MAG: DnaA family protein [Flavobacterium sp.]